MDLTSVEFVFGLCVGIVAGVFGTLFSLIAAEKHLRELERD